jgi:import inner membrane translocase subunit TIM17
MGGRGTGLERVFDDTGGAFGMGCIGGFAWNFMSGLRHGPSGEKFATALAMGKNRSSVLGGQFALWGMTFSCIDCSFQTMRGVDDSFNRIASGFCTGGVMMARNGLRAASHNAILGALILGIIETSFRRPARPLAHGSDE